MVLKWEFPSLKPAVDTLVLVEHLDGSFEEAHIEANFGDWADDVCRWAYLTRVKDMDYINYQRKVREKIYAEYREKITKLQQKNDDLTYLIHELNNQPNIPDDYPGECHTMSPEEIAILFRKECLGEDDKWSRNSNGKFMPTSDDNNESSNARSTREMSVNDLRDSFLAVSKREEERKRKEASEIDDGK